jgi:hypothetical protein
VNTVGTDPGGVRTGQSFGAERFLKEEGATVRIRRRDLRNPADHQISEELREV